MGKDNVREVRLTGPQFRQIDLQIGALNGAVNVIAQRIGPVDKDKSLQQALSTINETLRAGLSELVEAVAKLQPPAPAPAPKVEVKFMFVVKDDNPDVNFSVVLGDVTDAEGKVIPDAKLDVIVESSDPAVVGVTFDANTKSGSVHFGDPGVASVTAKVSSGDKLLGSGAADFTVTTGDPAAITSVGLNFEGLTEAPPA